MKKNHQYRTELNAGLPLELYVWHQYHQVILFFLFCPGLWVSLGFFYCSLYETGSSRHPNFRSTGLQMPQNSLTLDWLVLPLGRLPPLLLFQTISCMLFRQLAFSLSPSWVAGSLCTPFSECCQTKELPSNPVTFLLFYEAAISLTASSTSSADLVQLRIFKGMN